MATHEEMQAEIDGLKAEMGRIRKLNAGFEAEVGRLKGEATEARKALDEHRQEAEKGALLGELGLTPDDERTGEVLDLLRHLHGSIPEEEGKGRPSLVEHARALREADHWLLRGLAPATPAKGAAPKPKPAPGAPPPPQRTVKPAEPQALTPEAVARMSNEEWAAAKASLGGVFGEVLAGKPPAA